MYINTHILGERILAFADLVLDPKKFPVGFNFDMENINFPIENLRLLAITGLKDPPREEVSNMQYANSNDLFKD